MDIAFLSNVAYPFVTGGAEKRIHEIGTRLENKGHNITIYTRHYWDGPKEIVHEGMNLQAVAPEVELYTDGRRSITEALDFAIRLIPTLHYELSERNHDLIVASVFPYFPVLTGKLTLIGTDIPLITTWHEVWQDYWDEYLGYLALGGKITERITANIPQKPIAVSNATANQLARIGPSRDSIEVIPNGININEVQNAPLPRERGKQDFDVLFAGRLISDKNVDLLLEAFDTVAANRDITLGIIGEGPEYHKLKKQTCKLNNDDRVTFLGFLNEYEDVLGHMRAAEVFASPSTREGFGITYAEAMAANCSVVGVDDPRSAADEVIGDAGYLPDPTVESVANALESALSRQKPNTEPEKRAQQFDWDQIANKAESIYMEAIE